MKDGGIILQRFPLAAIVRTLALTFQLLAAAHAPLPAADSLALVNRVRDAQFYFTMDWRYQVQLDRYQAATGALGKARTFVQQTGAPSRGPSNTAFPTTGTRTGPTPLLKFPLDPLNMGCDPEETIRYDIDQHMLIAHMVKEMGDVHHVVCPVVSRQLPPPLEPGWADQPLSVEARDTIRAHRAAFLRLLDSAAHALPGDRWIAGQRVRFWLDQANIPTASRAVRECHTAPWWCSALQGYLLDAAGDAAGSVRALMTAQGQMPPDVRNEWDDIGPLLPYSERTTYAALPRATRDSLNATAWWLADPLFQDEGNERQAEQLMRRVLVALHDGQVDIWTDWRENYSGPTLRETVIRYGWPLTFPSCSSGMSMITHAPPPPQGREP